MGTENGYHVLKAMQDYLLPRVEVKTGTMVSEVLVEKGEVKGVETEDGEEYPCKYVILAPGREGADWLYHEAERLKLTMHNNPVDIGVRVEVPYGVMKELTDVLYEVSWNTCPRALTTGSGRSACARPARLSWSRPAAPTRW